ncbi:NYN domain-containing protein [Patescibacteria group bacterium]
MKKTVLYIDGENLRHYIEKVLQQEGIKKTETTILNVNLANLFKKVLKGIRITRRVYYMAKLRQHQSSLKKSKLLIAKQRKLKSLLENQGFKFEIVGNVRAQRITTNGRSKIIFREKGVDVKIAVDLVVAACEGKVERVIVCSSDSDLQPAIGEAKKRKLEVIYLGFETNPNKGLIYTCDRAILIRNSEIIEAFHNS